MLLFFSWNIFAFFIKINNSNFDSLFHHYVLILKQKSVDRGWKKQKNSWIILVSKWIAMKFWPFTNLQPIKIDSIDLIRFNSFTELKNPVEGRNFASHWSTIKQRYDTRKLNGLDLSLRKNPLLFAWQHPSKNLVNNNKNTAKNSSNCGVSCSKY